MRIFSLAMLVAGMWGGASAFAADASCPPLTPTSSVGSPGPSVLELVGDLPIGTTWARLAPETKARLQTLADERLAVYRANWSADALARKRDILLRCPTPAMTSAVDRYYQSKYPTVVPVGFTLEAVKSFALRAALVGNYLGDVAASRSALAYQGTKPSQFDWDGQSWFDSISLPERQTYEDIKAYHRQLLTELSKIDDSSLSELEGRLKQYATFSARSNSQGAAADSYGSDYLEQVCEIAALNYGVLAGFEAEHRRPGMFRTDDDVLREANAIYLGNTPLKWLDVGTRRSAFSSPLCLTDEDRVTHDIGDPAMDKVAKGMILLQRWWVERVMAGTPAKCTVYSPQDRERIWDAFSADQQFNNDRSSSMNTFAALLDRYKAEKTSHYREVARNALRLVFPDRAVLSQVQHDRLVAALDRRTDFGLFMSTMVNELDAAQQTSNGSAARLWAGAVAANMAYIGGSYGDGQSVREAEREEIKAMFEEVKAWIAQRYFGLPIDIASLYGQISVDVNTRHVATTEAGTARIWIGVGTRRSKAEYYSWLIHELRHAVNYARLKDASDKSRVSADEGPALEGSGGTVEDLLLLPFLQETLKNDTAVTLYMLDYGIRDARFAGTTDATLQRYFRAGCDSPDAPDTWEDAKNVARSYGLVDQLAETAAQRAHIGTQYLQYIWAGSYVFGEIDNLQTKINPRAGRRIDPYVLFACGLNTPRRDQDYVDRLKACIQ